MLYLSSALFLISFFWIMGLSKKYFAERVEKLIPIIEKHNSKRNKIRWSVDDDCQHISAEFLFRVNDLANAYED